MEEPPKHPAVAALFAELLAVTGLNAAGLAKKLEITPQAISNYVVGRNEPGRKMMAAIIKAFPAINAVWLATGEGEPFPSGRYNEKPAPAPTKETENPEPPRPRATMAVVRDVADMTPEQQAAYYKAMLELADEELDALKNAQRHERAVQLASSRGGQSFTDASLETADPREPAFMQVSYTNHDYQRFVAAARAPFVRPVVAGFVGSLS